MIYYFSGTGNSQHIATLMARHLNDTMCDITSPLPFEGDTLGLVMPVYAWGTPSIMDDFIANTLPSLTQGHPLTHVWCMLTHGDDMGYADTVLRRQLESVGIPLHAAYSLSMPNTYVCLPGFDVDSDSLADSKVTLSTESLHDICAEIQRHTHSTRVTRGAMAWSKTNILRPLFNAVLVTDRYFRAATPQCTRCGMCAKACPLHNIKVGKDSVSWGGHCTGCLRCYHLCPQRAIEFGRFTKGKGQKKKLSVP